MFRLTLPTRRGLVGALAGCCVAGLAFVPGSAAAPLSATAVDPNDEAFYLDSAELPQSPRYGPWFASMVDGFGDDDAEADRLCDESSIFNDPVLDDAEAGFRAFESEDPNPEPDEVGVGAVGGQYITVAPSEQAAAQFLRNAQRRHLKVCGSANGRVYRGDAKKDPNFKFERVRYKNLEIADGVRLFGIYVTFTECCGKRSPIGHSSSLLALGRDGRTVTVVLISTGDTKPNAPVRKFRATAKAAMAKIAG